MNEEQFERLLAMLERLACSMEGLQTINAALLEAVTVDDSAMSGFETKIDPLSTMDRDDESVEQP